MISTITAEVRNFSWHTFEKQCLTRGGGHPGHYFEPLNKEIYKEKKERPGPYCQASHLKREATFQKLIEKKSINEKIEVFKLRHGDAEGFSPPLLRNKQNTLYDRKKFRGRKLFPFKNFMYIFFSFFFWNSKFLLFVFHPMNILWKTFCCLFISKFTAPKNLPLWAIVHSMYVYIAGMFLFGHILKSIQYNTVKR